MSSRKRGSTGKASTARKRGGAETLCRVLFRDSSTLDGVQSRGAGWHTLDPHKTAEGAVALGSGSYETGDLVSLQGAGTRGGQLLVWDEGATRRVPEISGNLAIEHWTRESWAFAREVQGEPFLFWETAPTPAWLLHLAALSGLELHLLVALTCDGAESLLRFVSPREARPRRVARLVRRWTQGGAGREAVVEAYLLAGIALSDHDFGTAAHGALSAFYYAVRAATHTEPAQDLAESASISANSLAKRSCPLGLELEPEPEREARILRALKSLAFLVRARLPAWRVCLARARSEEAP